MSSRASSVSREERRPLVNAFVCQRRMLFGCTALMGFAVIVWILAISTDHWFIVSGGKGIFIPETRRYFQSSHSGLWKVCRYGITPHVLQNSTAARNFTTLAVTNATELNSLKRKFTQSELDVQEYLNVDQQVIADNLADLNEYDIYRRWLFASWVSNSSQFEAFKLKYKQRQQEQQQLHAIDGNGNGDGVVTVTKSRTPHTKSFVFLDPTNVTALKDIIGPALTSVTLKGIPTPLIVPDQLRNILFDGWQEKPSIVYLLWSFAKDMELPIALISRTGERYAIRPPLPAKKTRFANGYEYLPFKRCKYHDLFPDEQAIKLDPSIDEDIINYSRTEASFACITLVVMCMGFVFSIYTFLNPRYMFKRLAGGIHFIAASTSFVVIQVLAHSVDYERDHLTYSFPKGATFIYGYGFFLAWFVFVINTVAAILFLWYSKKKKGSKAPTDEIGMADEPTIIGR